MPRGRSVRQRGWPRKFIPHLHFPSFGTPGDRTMRPNIWLAGRTQLENNWLSFDPLHTEQYVRSGGTLCVVCGCKMERLWVFGHTGKFYTNGPAAHPRCFALALKFCPRFTQPPYDRPRQTVAYVWDRESGIPYLADTDRPPVNVLAPQQNDSGEHPTLTDFSLRPRAVRAFTRKRLVDLAKSDPMGAGQITNTRLAK